MQIRGSHPQTGAEIDEWGCTIAWTPMLLIENAKLQRETGAAVESFRNEMVKSSYATTAAMVEAISQNTRPNLKVINNEAIDN